MYRTPLHVGGLLLGDRCGRVIGLLNNSRNVQYPNPLCRGHDEYIVTPATVFEVAYGSLDEMGLF